MYICSNDFPMKQPTNEHDAFVALAACCATTEHCTCEMREKMRRWGLPADVEERVIARLTVEHYVDDERFCRAFVHDKARYSRWGQRKIEQALMQKHIATDIRQRVLNEMNAADYVATLRQLLESKRKITRARNDYELNGKLIRFALSRGFTMDIIRQCLSDADEYNYQEGDD